MIKGRIQTDTLRREVTFDELWPPEVLQEMRTAEARDVIAAVGRNNAQVLGREPPKTTWVDGQQGAPLTGVKSRVDTDWEIADDIVSWLATELVRASPIGPAKGGHFKDSFVIILNGAVLPLGAPIPADFEEVVIANTMPYARKIERGDSPQAPDGVFQALASVASRRFGNIARIRFTYVGLEGLVHLPYVPLSRPGSGRNGRGQFTAGSGDRAAAMRERASRTPAIRITPYG